MEDCAPDDPPFPPPEDTSVPPEHRDLYVRGCLTFILDNPGRQRIGSFHPLDKDDWMVNCFVSEDLVSVFTQITESQVPDVKAFVSNEANRVRLLSATDVFGRTALQLSIICGSKDITQVLLEADPTLV